MLFKYILHLKPIWPQYSTDSNVSYLQHIQTVCIYSLIRLVHICINNNLQLSIVKLGLNIQNSVWTEDQHHRLTLSVPEGNKSLASYFTLLRTVNFIHKDLCKCWACNRVDYITSGDEYYTRGVIDSVILLINRMNLLLILQTRAAQWFLDQACIVHINRIYRVG